MKKYLITTIISMLSTLFAVAEDYKVKADIITHDANEHYITIDYSKYNNFKTEEIGNEAFSTEKLINIHNLDKGNLDITFDYPCYKIDFNISTKWFAAWGIADIAVDETYNNDETWDDAINIHTAKGIKGHNQPQTTDKISHTNKIAKKIAIKQTGPTTLASDGKYVHDIKLYIAPHISFSSSTTLHFQDTKIGACKSYQTIEFYSFLTEEELVIEKPSDNFIITSINGQTPQLSSDGASYIIANNNTLRHINETNESKKYSIVIGFQPTINDNITETIYIKDTKNKKAINLEGAGFNKQPQTITWNQSLSSLQKGEVLTLDANSSSGLPITYTSTDPSIISINDNKLTAVENGTTTIIAFIECNDFYETATLEKYAKVGNGNINACSGNLILQTNSGGTGNNLTYTFKELPQIKNKIIKFDYTINEQKLTTNKVTFTITNNRDNTKQTHKDEKYWGSKSGSEEFILEKEDITEIYLTATSNQKAGVNISNIRIELEPTLYTNLTNTTSFPQTPVGESSSIPLKVSFAQLHDNIDISIIGTDAHHFSVNKNYIETGCGKFGIETINIYFSPKSYKEENYNATLVIKSDGQTTIEIPLLGTTFFRKNIFINEGHWNDQTNWSIGIPTGIGNNITINNTVTIPNGYSAEVNDITITDSGKIIIEPQGALKVAASINNTTTNNLTLQANDKGSAILVYNNTADNKVNASVQLFSIASSDGLRNGQAGNFKDPKWQYLGIVTEEVAFSTINPNGTSNWIYRWDETQNATSCWAEKLKSGSTLTVWTGYCLAQESATTYNYSGSLINSDHTYQLTYTENENSSDDLGNNLITNSYTAPIDITTISDANFTNAEANIYIYNTGSYLEWEQQSQLNGFNPGQVVVIPVNTVSALGNEYPRTIASAQAFFVKAIAENASFSIDYEKNVFGSIRKENVMRAKKLSDKSDKSDWSDKSDQRFNTLKIQVTSSISNDRLYLLEHESTTADFDNGYDAQKIFDNPNGPQIYASTPFGYASINTNYSFDGQEIGFVANNENELYTLSFDIENLHSYDQLWLFDTETELYVDILNQEEYQFYGSITPNNNRFRITSTRHDAPQGPTTAIENTTTWDDILTQNQPIYLYSITGQLIATLPPNSSFITPNSSFPIGIYIAKSGNKTIKIMVK